MERRASCGLLGELGGMEKGEERVPELVVGFGTRRRENNWVMIGTCSRAGPVTVSRFSRPKFFSPISGGVSNWRWAALDRAANEERLESGEPPGAVDWPGSLKQAAGMSGGGGAWGLLAIM